MSAFSPAISWWSGRVKMRPTAASSSPGWKTTRPTSPPPLLSASSARPTGCDCMRRIRPTNRSTAQPPSSRARSSRWYGCCAEPLRSGAAIHGGRPQLIHLVEGQHLRLLEGAEVLQRFMHRLHLVASVVTRRVEHVEQEVGLLHLFERGPEGGHQVGG